MPDGTGLPVGEGTVDTGATVYTEHCASCHGPEGEGGTAAALVGTVPGGGPPFGPRYEEWRGDRDHVPYTIGNYWPYATTLFDYVRRAMPSSAPGSLTDNQVYGLVAWLLARNEIIGNDAVMNAETLAAVEMPARDIFVPDDRRGGREVK
jgi:cytochrome c